MQQLILMNKILISGLILHLLTSLEAKSDASVSISYKMSAAYYVCIV